MGTIKTTNIEPIADNGTVTLGSSGDTFTVPSGVTVSGAMANTPSFFAYLNSDQGSVADNTITKVTIDTEVYDTASAFASNKFTPGVAGKYYIFGQVCIDSTNTHSYDKKVFIYKNGSAAADHELPTDLALAGNSHYHVSISTIVEANTTDYFELFGLDNNQGNHTATFRGGQKNTYFGAYRIIGA
jgi:hypothetical protein